MSSSEFYSDVVLCFENAKKYCRKRFPNVYQIAIQMCRVFKEAFTARIGGIKPSSSSSNTDECTQKITNISPAQQVKRKLDDDNLNAKGHEKTLEISNIGGIGGSGGSGSSSGGENLSFSQKACKILDILSTFKLYDMLSSPVDVITFSDYPLKIPNPLDFSAIRSNFSGKKSTYASPDQFARDVRRVLGNCLRYNYPPSGLTIRQEARKILYRFESEWSKHFPDCKQVTD
jgi:hypothetical protein